MTCTILSFFLMVDIVNWILISDMYENGPEGEPRGFSVSSNMKSHTKVAEKKTNVTENVTVYDTKGFLDTSNELADEYKNSKDSRKIQ